MGLCASVLQWKAKRRQQQQQQQRGTPKALFVVRNGAGRPSRPQALVVHGPPRGSGRSGSQSSQKAGDGEAGSRKRGYECYDCVDVLGRRLPCGSTRSVAAVEPVVTAGTRPAPVSRPRGGATADGKKAVAVAAAAAAAPAAEGCRTPMTPRRTPVWQRRILMGTRCELPRFSGLILYDEHGRPLQSSSQNRADHLMSRASKYEPKGKKKTASARATTTLRDLM